MDEEYDITIESTEDIQHDLAQMMTVTNSRVNCVDLILEYRNELVRRKAKIPTNARYEQSSYALFGRRLMYDLINPEERNTKEELSNV